MAVWVTGRCSIDDSAGRLQGGAADEEEACGGDTGESTREGGGFIMLAG